MGRQIGSTTSGSNSAHNAQESLDEGQWFDTSLSDLGHVSRIFTATQQQIVCNESNDNCTTQDGDGSIQLSTSWTNRWTHCEALFHVLNLSVWTGCNRTMLSMRCS